MVVAATLLLCTVLEDNVKLTVGKNLYPNLPGDHESLPFFLKKQSLSIHSQSIESSDLEQEWGFAGEWAVHFFPVAQARNYFWAI